MEDFTFTTTADAALQVTDTDTVITVVGENDVNGIKTGLVLNGNVLVKTNGKDAGTLTVTGETGVNTGASVLTVSDVTLNAVGTKYGIIGENAVKAADGSDLAICDQTGTELSRGAVGSIMTYVDADGNAVASVTTAVKPTITVGDFKATWIEGTETKSRELVSYDEKYWIQSTETFTFTVGATGVTHDKTYTLNGVSQGAWPENWAFDGATAAADNTIVINGANATGLTTSMTIKFGMDSTGPTVTAKYSTEITDLLSISAEFSDTGSGVNTMEYSLDGKIWYTYTGSIAVRLSDFADKTAPTVTFKGTDRAGNVTTTDAVLTGILVETIINAATDYTTLSKEATLKVTVAEGSVVVDNKYSWSKDGGVTWQDATIGQTQKITENGTYSIRLVDGNSKVWTKDVTYTNIEVEEQGVTTKSINLDGSLNGNVTEDFTVAEGENVIAPDLSVTNGTLTVQKDASLTTETLELNGNSELAIKQSAEGENLGTASFEKLNVSGKGNSLDKSIDLTETSTKTVEVQREADLTLNKDQYDDLMNIRQFESIGTLNVTKADGNNLDQADIQKLIDVNTVRSVQFEDTLTGIQKLTFGDNGSLDIGFAGAVGDEKKSTTLTFAKNSNVKLGDSDTTIELKAGNNKIDIKANATVDIRSDIQNVSTVNVASGSTVKVIDAGGKSAKQQMFTIANLADVNFSAERSGNLSIGKFNDATVGEVVGAAAKSNKISVGANSEVKIASVKDVSNFNVTSGSQYKELSTDSAKVQGITEVQVGDFVGSQGRKDKITTGSYTDVTVESINFLTADTASLSKNAISIGGKSEFAVSGVIENLDDNENTSIYGVNSLKAGNGAYDKKSAKTTWTEVNIAGDVVGTDGNDTVQFGNYNDAKIGGAVVLGKGKDTFKVGNDSSAIVGDVSSDALTMSIGSRSDVTTGAISGLVKLTTSAGTYDKKTMSLTT